ncbi:MAG: 8-oxo-dGTP diphosphatase [Candidatus Azambacteria bacterium]|nr:8-oxo-dGTP diphosphatase [Candidatus Azambacteria bacterium]
MEEEKMLLNATLCFLVKDNKVLLGFKTEKIGKDCWNGYGGGINDGETPKQAALRELKEEADIVTLPESLEKAAVVDFHNTKSDGSTFVCRVHVYLVSQWTGNPRVSDEMINPTWFSIERLPLDKMMPADRDWLPVVLSGKKIIATTKLGPFQKTLLGPVKLQQVDSFPDD